MSDPKYANLYGIAQDQPDVYETNDLPEADQSANYEIADDAISGGTDSIERLHISTADAYSLFKSKQLDSANVDFSPNIRRVFGTAGYNSYRSNEDDCAIVSLPETPTEKLTRIKCELQCLSEELSLTSDEDAAAVAATVDETQEEHRRRDGSAKLSIKKDVDDLLKKVSTLTLNDSSLFWPDERLLSAPDTQFISLKEKLEKLSSSCNVTDMKQNRGKEDDDDVLVIGDSTSGDSAAVKYQLIIKPNQALLSYTSRIADLENRLTSLEKNVGRSNEQFCRASGIDREQCGMLEYSEWIISKLSLLDTAQLDSIEARAGVVNGRLDQLAEKIGVPANQSYPDQKIDELYGLYNRAMELSELIPTMLDRMRTLESLHKRGEHYLEMLNNLELLQNEMMVKVKNNDLLLGNVENTLQSNLSTIAANMESLQKRLDALTSGNDAKSSS